MPAPCRRRHRCHVRDRGARPVRDGTGGHRPVGAVVRSLQDPQPDPREGDRRDRRPGRAGQDQRRREPGPAPRFRCSASRRCTPSATASGRRVHRRPGRAVRPSMGRSAVAHRRRARDHCALEAGDEPSLRKALELDPGNESADRGARRAAGRERRRRRGARAARADPRDRRDAAGGRVGEGRAGGRRGSADDDIEADSGRCSIGSRTTRTPASSTSTCSSCWDPMILAPGSTAGSWRPASTSILHGSPAFPVAPPRAHGRPRERLVRPRAAPAGSHAVVDGTDRLARRRARSRPDASSTCRRPGAGGRSGRRRVRRGPPSSGCAPGGGAPVRGD